MLWVSSEYEQVNNIGASMVIDYNATMKSIRYHTGGLISTFHNLLFLSDSYPDIKCVILEVINAANVIFNSANAIFKTDLDATPLEFYSHLLQTIQRSIFRCLTQAKINDFAKMLGSSFDFAFETFDFIIRKLVVDSKRRSEEIHQLKVQVDKRTEEIHQLKVQVAEQSVVLRELYLINLKLINVDIILQY